MEDPVTGRLVGSSISGVTIQGFISQEKARRFAGGTLVSCGSTSGTSTRRAPC